MEAATRQIGRVEAMDAVNATTWEALLITVPFALAPLVAAAFRLRLGLWIYLAAIPAFMYHKSMFLAWGPLDWPPLAKDVTALVLAVVLLAHPRVRSVLWRTRRRFALPFAAFFVAFAVAGLLSGEGAFATAVGLRAYLFYALLGFAIGAFLVRDRRAWTSLARAFALIGLALASLALIQYYFDADFLIHPSMATLWNGNLYDWYTYRERLRSIFSNPNLLGFFSGLGLLAFIWFGLRARTFATRMVLALVSSSLVLALVLSNSRSALLGLLATLVLVLVATRPLRSVPYLLAAAVLVAGIAQTGAYAGRFDDLGNNPRLAIWQAHLEAVATSPSALSTGFGPGSVGRTGRTANPSDVVVEGIAARLGVPDDRVHFVDNAFVKAVYEVGLLGVAYLAWTISFYLLTLRRVIATRDPSQRWLLAVPLIVMTLILSVSVFSDSLMTYPWSLLYWLAAGGVAAQASPHHRSPKAGSTPSRTPGSRVPEGARA